MVERDTRRGRRGFGYDVSVAVLANLVATSAIYLFAVYGGYLAKNTDLVVVSVAIIMGALVAVLASLPGRMVR